MQQIIISIYRGMVQLESCPNDIKVILRDHDIQEIESDNPDREYGNDELGDYEISEL